MSDINFRSSKKKLGPFSFLVLLFHLVVVPVFVEEAVDGLAVLLPRNAAGLHGINGNLKRWQPLVETKQLFNQSYTHFVPTPANLPLHISLSRTQPNNLREELTLEHFAVVGAEKPHNSKMRVDRSDLIVIPFSVSTRVCHLVIVCFFQPSYTGQAVQQATQWSSSSWHCVACCLTWPM